MFKYGNKTATNSPKNKRIMDIDKDKIEVSIRRNAPFTL